MLPVFLLVSLLSSSAFSQKLTIKLYELKAGISVRESLQFVHRGSMKRDSKKDLNHDEWIEVQPFEGALRMKPDRFYVLEVSGLSNVPSNGYTYELDPEITGVTLSDPLYVPDSLITKDTKISTNQIGDWLNYAEFRSEDMGRYNDVDANGIRYANGNKRGLLYKSPKQFEGKVREFTCYVNDPSAPVSAVTIEY